MNGPWCTDGSPHSIEEGTLLTHVADDVQSAVCAKCRHPIRRFYVDDEEDRRGGWSKWATPRYVINLDLFEELAP